MGGIVEMVTHFRCDKRNRQVKWLSGEDNVGKSGVSSYFFLLVSRGIISIKLLLNNIPHFVNIFLSASKQLHHFLVN